MRVGKATPMLERQEMAVMMMMMMNAYGIMGIYSTSVTITSGRRTISSNMIISSMASFIIIMGKTSS